MRDDLKLAAYAVALGYTLQIDSTRRRGEPVEPGDFIQGVPHDGLQFEKGRAHVWDTARGWRASALNDEGRYPHPAPPEEFHRTLLQALNAGVLLAAA